MCVRGIDLQVIYMCVRGIDLRVIYMCVYICVLGV